MLFSYCGYYSRSSPPCQPPNFNGSVQPRILEPVFTTGGCRTDEDFFRQTRRFSAAILTDCKGKRRSMAGKRPPRRRSTVVNTGSYCAHANWRALLGRSLFRAEAMPIAIIRIAGKCRAGRLRPAVLPQTARRVVAPYGAPLSAILDSAIDTSILTSLFRLVCPMPSASKYLKRAATLYRHVTAR